MPKLKNFFLFLSFLFMFLFHMHSGLVVTYSKSLDTSTGVLILIKVFMKEKNEFYQLIWFEKFSDLNRMKTKFIRLLCMMPLFVP